jgi:DNA-binding NtrC family response regulator
MQILVVDDEESQRDLLAGFLKKKGHTVATAESGMAALETAKTTGFDLAIMDLKMPELDGIEIMARLKAIDPATYFIILTGYGTVEGAVRAMKLGAYDFLGKPVNLDELEIRIDRIQDEQRTREDLQILKAAVEEKFSPESFIAESPKMQEILALIPRIAKSDTTVLILGESGTGKELVARLIHQSSSRKDRRFVAISCAALPETLLESELFGYERGAFTGADKRKIGKFEIANQGTLFLDEIGDLPVAIQVKLLRVLQEFSFERLGGNSQIKVDIRVVTATNQDLKKKILAGQFREDLYYRLNVISLELPPLRERREDIKPMAEYFLRQVNERGARKISGFTHEALNLLLRYRWPGNVRELENVVERTAVLCRSDVIEVRDLPLSAADHAALPVGTLAEVEKAHIAKVLYETGGNLSQTAERLGIHRNTLRLKIREYGLKKDDA